MNHESDPMLQNKDVRWALALALDIVEMQTEYIGGVAKVTPFPVPPTAKLYNLYHGPMTEWLTNLQIDLGDGRDVQPLRSHRARSDRGLGGRAGLHCTGRTARSLRFRLVEV